MKHKIEGTIFYHEDDFCQVEILPKENLPSLLRECEDITDFSTNNEYSDMYVRENNEISLNTRKIKKTELEQVLMRLEIEKHTKVLTGYGSDYRVESKNTIGFGEAYSAIYFDYENETETVKNIWVTNLFGLNHDKVINILFSIGEKWNLLLMDWDSLELIDLSNKKMIREYLE